MGSVIKRIVLAVAFAALLVPGLGHAGGTTEYRAPYTAGPGGGDGSNTKSANGATGEVYVVRHQAAGVNGGLGCGGSGGWITLERAHVTEGTVTSVKVAYADALVTPFAFLKVSVMQDGRYLVTTNVRGPFTGAGEIVVPAVGAHPGNVTVRFGAEVSSACPGVEVARAIYQKVIVTEA